ncbi:hypothetical protein AgCh_022865 [Apium graveolens]
MEAEFVALDKCAEEAEYLRQFLEDIPRWPKPLPLLKGRAGFLAGMCLPGIETPEKLLVHDKKLEIQDGHSAQAAGISVVTTIWLRKKNMGRRRLSFAALDSTNLSLVFAFIIYSLLSLPCCKAASPSSCGNIQNISCPFTLKGDHQKCNASFFTYELSCINNRTTLYLLPDRHLYYVESISYGNFSIRVVDPGLQRDNHSSLPIHSIGDYELSRQGSQEPLSELNQPVTMIECPSPVISTRYINITSPNSSSSALVFGRKLVYSYAYVVTGSLDISELEDDCRINKVAWVSLRSPFSKVFNNFSEIHSAMVYGFELPWSYFYCLKCEAAFNENFFCYTYELDHRSWVCETQQRNSQDCNPLHLSSYHLSISCTGHNLHVIAETLRSKETQEVFGEEDIKEIQFIKASLVFVFVYIFKGITRARRRHLSMYDTIEDFLQSQNNLMPIRYAYSDIRKITNNFRDKVGEGAFGTVYKGKLRSGHLVAVKILGKSKATGQEFINEVATSGRIHHVSVVELIGFCFEGPKRALIYEFMPNGSLEKYIFRKEGTEEEIVSLSWEKQVESTTYIENFNPVISDFGLAKSYATDDSIVTLTAARGTMGYMAPEMFYKNIGGISYKADVYSFGMLLMEMAGRRKNLNPFVDHVSQIHFPSWVYDQFSEGKELEIEDVTEEERKLVKKMIIVALWCIQMKPTERPSMNKVIEMLEGNVEQLVMPPKPFLYPQQEDPAEIDNIIHSSSNLLQAEE